MEVLEKYKDQDLLEDVIHNNIEIVKNNPRKSRVKKF